MITTFVSHILFNYSQIAVGYNYVARLGLRVTLTMSRPHKYCAQHGGRRSATAPPNRRGTNVLFLLVSVTIALIAVPAVAHHNHEQASTNRPSSSMAHALLSSYLNTSCGRHGFTALDTFKKNFEERLSATLRCLRQKPISYLQPRRRKALAMKSVRADRRRYGTARRRRS